MYIGADGIGVALRRGWHQPVIAAAWHAHADSSAAGIIDTLGQALATLGAVRRVQLRLASPLLRLALMPFDRATANPAVEAALACTLIEKNFGLAPGSQRIAVSPACFGRPRLIAAMDEDRAAMIEAAISGSGRELVAMLPAAAAAFAAAFRQASAPGTFALPEADRLLLIDHDGIGPESIRVRPWSPGETLPALAPGRQGLCASENVRADNGWQTVMLPQPRWLTRVADPRILLATCGD